MARGIKDKVAILGAGLTPNVLAIAPLVIACAREPMVRDCPAGTIAVPRSQLTFTSVASVLVSFALSVWSDPSNLVKGPRTVASVFLHVLGSLCA